MSHEAMTDVAELAASLTEDDLNEEIRQIELERARYAKIDKSFLSAERALTDLAAEQAELDHQHQNELLQWANAGTDDDPPAPPDSVDIDRRVAAVQANMRSARAAQAAIEPRRRALS